MADKSTREVKLQLSLNAANEPQDLSANPSKLANSLKAMRVHSSKFSDSTKLRYTAPTDLYEDTLEKQINYKEETKLLGTDIKFEPKCFRGEKRKASFDNNYITCELIGAGSYGEVRKIRDKVTGEYRALKTFSKENCHKTDNFADEISIVKRLVTCVIT